MIPRGFKWHPPVAVMGSISENWVEQISTFAIAYHLALPGCAGIWYVTRLLFDFRNSLSTSQKNSWSTVPRGRYLLKCGVIAVQGLALVCLALGSWTRFRRSRDLLWTGMSQGCGPRPSRAAAPDHPVLKGLLPAKDLRAPSNR